MPKTFDSMQSFMWPYSVSKIRSSESRSSSRYFMRLTVRSFEPSCTHTFMIEGSSCARPISSATARQRFVCSIQNSRIAGSGFASDRSPDSGCENDVELKSSFMPLALPHSIQPAKWRGSISLRSTCSSPNSP